MAPIICIRIPDFALQVLRLRTRVEEAVPLITVRDDRPAARVTACNAAAIGLGVRPGMRYAQALSLDYSIRAGVVTPRERDREMDQLERLILDVVPQVERSRFEEGLFWIPTAGLDRHVTGVHGEGRSLSRILAERIEATGRRVCTAVGQSRAAPAVATALDVEIGFDRFDREWEWLLRQPAAALPIPPEDGERLRFLGLRVIGDLVRLPEGQLRRRMSGRTAEIYRFLQEERRIPIYHHAKRRRFSREYRFEHRITSTERLLERIEPLLADLRDEAVAAALWINAVTITIRGEMETPWQQRITGGSPTKDMAFLRRLVSLRLESHAPGSEELVLMRVEIDCTPGAEQQVELIARETGAAPIDRRRLDDAILTLQAELGNRSLLRVLPGDDVVPERRLRLAPADTGRDLLCSDGAGSLSGFDGIRRVRLIALPGCRVPMRPDASGARSTGRGPTPTAAAPPRGDRAAAPAGATPPATGTPTTAAPATAAVLREWGPFLLSSRWWTGEEIERIYRYRLGSDGTLFWEYTRPGTEDPPGSDARSPAPLTRRRRVYTQGLVG